MIQSLHGHNWTKDTENLRMDTVSLNRLVTQSPRCFRPSSLATDSTSISNNVSREQKSVPAIISNQAHASCVYVLSFLWYDMLLVENRRQGTRKKPFIRTKDATRSSNDSVISFSCTICAISVIDWTMATIFFRSRYFQRSNQNSKRSSYLHFFVHSVPSL